MTIAADWFASAEDFRIVLLEAQGRAKTDKAIKFVNSLVTTFKNHELSTYLSEKQLTWLCTIAGTQKPGRVRP